MKKPIKGFSMAEMLVVMVIVMVLLVAAFPLITMKKKTEGMDMSAVSCIKNILTNNSSLDISELACSSTPDDACCVAVKNCYYNQSNSCPTIKYYADMGKTNAEIYAARKLFREVCDRGGKEGCKYFVDLCNQDSTSCDVSNPDLGEFFDLKYYLSLTNDGSNAGMGVIEQIIDKYYDNGYSNITTYVDSTADTCTCPIVNLACITKGTICEGSTPTTPTGPTTPTMTPWQKDMGGVRGDYAGAAYMDNNDIYISGYTNEVDGNGSIAVLKLDNNGNIIWQKALTISAGATGASANDIAVNNGYVYTAGAHPGSSINNRIMSLVKMDTAGTLIWQKKIGGKGMDTASAIAVSNNYIYIAGKEDSDSFKNADIYAAKLDNDGNMVWQKKIGGNGDDYGVEIAIESGNIFIAGYQDSAYVSGSRTDAILIKLDDNGNVIWQKIYGNSASDAYDRASDLNIYNGNIYVGVNTDPGFTDMVFLKLDINGNIIWQKQFGGTYNDDYYGGIALDTSENIYVTGRHSPGSGYRMAILKLDPNGNLIWQKVYDGVSDEYPADLLLYNNNYLILYGSQMSYTYGSTDIELMLMSKNQTNNLSLLFNNGTFATKASALSVGNCTLTVDIAGLVISDRGYGIRDSNYTGLE